MTKSVMESEMVLSRFEEIVPPVYIDGYCLDDLKLEVHVAFQIIGYTPKNLEKSVKSAFESMDGKGALYRLCYHAWRCDE